MSTGVEVQPLSRLVDRYGRSHTDLRLSLTDRCGLRCTYCMPAEGMPWLPREEILSDDEMVRLVRIAVSLGVRELRLTGGEPLVRPGVPDLVARIAALDPRPRVALTTNGLKLPQLAGPLAAVGLDRVNVSLDTIRPDTFRALTRRDGLGRVIDGLAAAADAGLHPVKVNAVLVRGVNEGEECEMLRWCLDRRYELRFIEWMPLDAGHTWRRDLLVPGHEILARLRKKFQLTPAYGRGSDPAETWLVDGGPGRVGVVASVTQPFCGACDRIRITADGQLRNCLFAREESDLRGSLRAGADDADLAARMISAVARKRAGHGIDDPSFVQPQRGMSAIGG